ncbi:MAG: c-type cytochrome domain-containing protein [Chitinophagaceae bacterium]
MRLFILSLAILLGYAACVHPPLNALDGNVQISAICSADSVYFVNDIQPILTSNCNMSGCHNAGDKKDGVDLSNYASIMKTAEVKPFKATSSELYEVLLKTDPDKRMPRPPASPLSSLQIEKIKTWINQGAKNNACLSCDTANIISFSAHIQPILQNNCTGCHSGASPSGAIGLENYTQTMTQVTNGKLLGSVKQLSGFSAMPKGGAKLSDCNINQIEKWIAQGAPNN